jgi:hypothetical protein
MAKDFKAGQVKTSKIIGKAGEKTVFYTDADASGSDTGVHGVDEGGDDVSFVFSGSPDDKLGALGGVTLFNGDLVVSGTLYAENQVINVVSTADSGLIIEGENIDVLAKKTAIHIKGDEDGAIVWTTGDGSTEHARIHVTRGGSPGVLHLNSVVGIGGNVIASVSGNSAAHIATCADIKSYTDIEVSAVASAVADNDDDILALQALSGVADEAVNMGTFTGSLLTANQDVKALMQIVGTAIEGNDTDIATNTSDIGTNAGAIATNTSDIGKLSTVNASEGASLIGIQDSGSNFTATDVEGALIELATSGGGGGNLTTKGDLEVYTTTQGRLPIGGNGTVLTANSLAGAGLEWASSMTSFSIADIETPTAGGQAITDGNTLIVAGANGITSTVSATDTLTITLDDTTVTPSTYGDTTNVPQLTVDQQGRITGVSNVAISAGSSSVGVAGDVQITDGSGGFDAASVLKYHEAGLPAGSGVDSKVSIGPPTGIAVQARLEVVNLAADAWNCLKVQQLSGTAANMIPVIIESNTNDMTADLAIANLGGVSEIKLANTFVASAGPSFKSTQILMDNDNFKIVNNQVDAITEIIGKWQGASVQEYNIIRGEANAAHNPCVTILTDPGFSGATPLMSPEAVAAIASNDINFYVEGTAGSLGSTVNKKSAQFGGDVKVEGCVSRGGLLQLTKDIAQRLGSPAWNGTTTWDATNVPRGVITFNASPIIDTTFYSFTPGNDFVTLNRDGDYRVSYGVWMIQEPNTDLSVDNGASGAVTGNTAVLGQRSNITGRLVIDSGAGFSIVDNSYSSCYLRFNIITRNLFTTTTFVSANTGDKLGVELAWIQGDNPGGSEFLVQPGQTWLTIERIA